MFTKLTASVKSISASVAEGARATFGKETAEDKIKRLVEEKMRKSEAIKAEAERIALGDKKIEEALVVRKAELAKRVAVAKAAQTLNAELELLDNSLSKAVKAAEDKEAAVATVEEKVAEDIFKGEQALQAYLDSLLNKHGA
jgi:hypothetical protein